ncbi:MAG: PilN domain-containing protein [Gammaproteobacteria bacterium]|nr:PilN domain-containing protein [Gammaproteobacteria bacterium]
MRRINLLPWREEQRREQQTRFSRQTMMLLAGLAVVLVLIYAQTASSLSEQRQRNVFLQQQIRSLQEDINRYQGVSGDGSSSKEGLKVLAGLKKERQTLVRILDELPRRVPEGVSLSEIKQQAQVLRISGMADTSARVSEFLRQLDQSENFSSARLTLIKVAEKNSSQQGHSFVLEVSTQQGKGR